MGAKGSFEISLEERKSIEKLVSLGWTIGAIASSIGRSHSGVKLELKRNGGRHNYNALKAQEAHAAARRARTAHKQKGFTSEQLQIIKEGLDRGDPYTQIMERSGVTIYMLKQYVKRNGIVAKKMNYASFIERIEAIESQIEIILDLIKELSK